MEFSVKEIMELLLRRIVLIMICTVTGLGLFFVASKFIIRPSYTASVQLYVNANDTTSPANLNELNYAQKVVATYINFLQTKVFYQQVIEETDLNYKPERLRKMTSIQSVNNTEIFRISVTTHSPEDAYKLVEAMQRVAPVLIQSIKETAQISVVDPVELPGRPSGPNILLNSLLGGFIGLVFSILAIMLWEIIDVNVKNQEDLNKRYKLPVLGAIPNFDTSQAKKIIRKNRIFKDRENLEFQINEDTKFVITEAYKTLRTNMRFSLRSNMCKKIIICSPMPEEGKSTTSTNLAITIAQMGAKVLLMDCDLRKGRLHRYFNIKSMPGISDVLSGITDVKDVTRKTANENLHILPMGAIPPNPTELLGSVQMEELLSKLDKIYDYIIIDTPPINVVSDSLSLSKVVDGVILVVKEGETSHPNIVSAIGKYEFAEANLLGFVLNGVTLEQGKRKKSHYYYYRNSDSND